MSNFFDLSQVKFFKLEDLTGRTLNLQEFYSKDENLTIIAAFDVKSGDTFLLTAKREPIGVESTPNNPT